MCQELKYSAVFAEIQTVELRCRVDLARSGEWGVRSEDKYSTARAARGVLTYLRTLLLETTYP
jgi:hypothetical protein